VPEPFVVSIHGLGRPWVHDLYNIACINIVRSHCAIKSTDLLSPHTHLEYYSTQTIATTCELTMLTPTNFTTILSLLSHP
jgi:hypothetical protein